MCLALVFNITLPQHPQEHRRSFQYKKGMIITVIEDGQQFGSGDYEAHARVIDLPGIPALDLADLCTVQETVEIAVISGEPTRVRHLRGIRRWRAPNIDAVPATVNVTRQQVATFIANNFTLEPDPVIQSVIG